MSSFALHSVPRNAPWRVRSARLIAGLVLGLSLTLGMAGGAKAQKPPTMTCPADGGSLPAQPIILPTPSQQPDLLVDGICTVVPGQEYFYANVNIRNNGVLTFTETTNSRTNLWVSSIIIENGGTMTAGETTPFGTNGGTLKIHIYGKAFPSAVDINGKPVPPQNQGQGAVCQSAMPGTAPCAIPQKLWDYNAMDASQGADRRIN
jgi:hypothetical protein